MDKPVHKKRVYHFRPRSAEAHLAMEEKLALLRDYDPMHERTIYGRENLLAYLNALGVRKRNGTPYSNSQIIELWKRKYGFPMFVWKRGKPCGATTLAIHAWLWAGLQEYKKLKEYKSKTIKDNRAKLKETRRLAREAKLAALWLQPTKPEELL